MPERYAPRLLFASYHAYADPSSGAALATRDLMQWLAGRHWQPRVLCGSKSDFDRPESLLQWLRDQQLPYRSGRGGAASLSFQTVHYCQNDVPVAVYLPDAPGPGAPSQPEGYGFLALLEQAFDEFRPDVLFDLRRRLGLGTGPGPCAAAGHQGCLRAAQSCLP